MEKINKTRSFSWYLSVIGIVINSFILIFLLIAGKSWVIAIISGISLFEVFYYVSKYKEARQIIDNKEHFEVESKKLQGEIEKLKLDINSLNDTRNEIINDSKFELDKINSKNIETIDELTSKNNELQIIIENLVEQYKTDIKDLIDENESDIKNLKDEYEIKVQNLIKEIEDLKLWNEQKKNDLKEEALFEYLSLIKDDYHQQLLDQSDENLNEDIYLEPINTYVAGTNYKNPEGESRQKIIREYVKVYHDSNIFDKDDFNFVSNEQIIEEGNYYPNMKYFQYELEEYDTVILKEEPDNPHDENAIAIIHNDMGHIGYIPKRDIKRVKDYLDSGKKITYILTLKGGKYKYFDAYEDKIESDTTPYQFNLTIKI